MAASLSGPKDFTMQEFKTCFLIIYLSQESIFKKEQEKSISLKKLNVCLCCLVLSRNFEKS